MINYKTTHEIEMMARAGRALEAVVEALKDAILKRCGDEFVTLKVMLPEKPDPELEKFISQWRGAYTPRQAMEA